MQVKWQSERHGTVVEELDVVMEELWWRNGSESQADGVLACLQVGFSTGVHSITPLGHWHKKSCLGCRRRRVR